MSLVAERERASIRGTSFGLTAHNTYLGAEWEVRPKLALRIGRQNGQATYGVGFERGRFNLQAARVGDVADKELAPIFGKGNHLTIVQVGYQF